MQLRDLGEQSFQLILMQILLSLQFYHDCAHLLVYLGEFCLFPSGPDVELHSQTVDQFAELGVFVEQLRIVLEKQVELGLKAEIGVFLLGFRLFDFLVWGGKADIWRFLAVVWVACGRGLSHCTFLGRHGSANGANSRHLLINIITIIRGF